MLRKPKPSFFFLVQAFLAVFSSCSNDEPTIQDCPTYFDFELPEDTVHFFDYSKKQTIRYKRSTDLLIDTVVFNLIESDTGHHRYVTGINGDGGGCYETSDNYQFISYKYYSKEDNSLIRVYLENHVSNFGIVANLFIRVNQTTFDYTVGGAAGIGNINAGNYSYKVQTKDKLYYNNWENRGAYNSWFFPQEKGERTDDEENRLAYYNPDFGVVQMEFKNGTEKWELIL